jgi:hypothetical protein
MRPTDLTRARRRVARAHDDLQEMEFRIERKFLAEGFGSPDEMREDPDTVQFQEEIAAEVFSADLALEAALARFHAAATTTDADRGGCDV